MIHEKKAVTAIEYGMLLSLIAAIVIVPVTSTGTSLQRIFCQMSGVLGGSACVDVAATPGAGEVPFPYISPLPAGTVCKTQSDGYPTSNGVAGFVRACTAPDGTLYSAAYIAYDSATGAVNTTVFQGSTSNLMLAQNGTGETLEVPTPNGPVSVLTSGNYYPNPYYTQYFNAEIFNNAAFATTEGTTIPAEIANENQQYEGVSTSLGSENTAMNYISGVNISGSPVPTQTGSGNAVFLYSAGY